MQNYIDNTGVQVADVVAGFHYLEKKIAAEVQALIDRSAACRSIISAGICMRASRSYYKDHPEALEWRSETLHAIEAGEGEMAELAHMVADAIVDAHLRDDASAGHRIRCAAARERDSAPAVLGDRLRATEGAQSYLLRDRRQEQGCWVMPSSAFRTLAEGDERRRRQQGHRALERHCDVRRQRHRVPALEIRAARARISTTSRWSNIRTAMRSGSRPISRRPEPTPAFRRASAGLQRHRLAAVVSAGCRGGGLAGARLSTEQADKSIHFSYEMVALSPRTCVELGIELSEEDKRRPYVEVSGRKGLGVKADDLIDKLIETALAEVDQRHPEAAAPKNADGCHADRHRRAALFHAEVHAKFRDRLRFP